jgi:hypothetical protein
MYAIMEQVLGWVFLPSHDTCYVCYDSMMMMVAMVMMHACVSICNHGAGFGVGF